MTTQPQTTTTAPISELGRGKRLRSHRTSAAAPIRHRTPLTSSSDENLPEGDAPSLPSEELPSKRRRIGRADQNGSMQPAISLHPPLPRSTRSQRTRTRGQQRPQSRSNYPPIDRNQCHRRTRTLPRITPPLSRLVASTKQHDSERESTPLSQVLEDLNHPIATDFLVHNCCSIMEMDIDSFNPTPEPVSMTDDPPLISPTSAGPRTIDSNHSSTKFDEMDVTSLAPSMPPPFTESPLRRLRPSSYQREMDLLTPIVDLQLTIYLDGEVKTKFVANKYSSIRPHIPGARPITRPPILLLEDEHSMTDVHDRCSDVIDESMDEDEIKNRSSKDDDDTVMQTDDVFIDSNSTGTSSVTASSDSTIRREICVSGKMRILELSNSVPLPKKRSTNSRRIKQRKGERRIYHILVEMNQVYHERIKAETDHALPTSLVFDEKHRMEPVMTSELLAMIVQYERAKYFKSPRFPPITTSRLLTPRIRRGHSRKPGPPLHLAVDDGREISIPKNWYTTRIRESISEANFSLKISEPHQPSTEPEPFRSEHPFQPTLLTIREDCASYRLVGGWTGRSVYWDVGDPMYMDLEWKTLQNKRTPVAM